MTDILKKVLAVVLAFSLGPSPLAAQGLAVPGALGYPKVAPPAAQPTYATLESYENFVEVQKGDAGPRLRLKTIPTPLDQGDRIHTYRKGKAVVSFRDGSKVELGPYTIFMVERSGSGGISLRVSLGRVRVWVAKLQSRTFEVRTPVAVASVRGTQFMVDVPSEKITKIEVYEGIVAVQGLIGREVLLNPAERIDVSATRMGDVQKMEEKAREEREKKESRREEREGDRLKAALEREVGFQLGREAIESAAAFEMKNAQYQDGKTIIDAFGERVRIEEYITRPDARSFKFVTLNFREGRLDTGLMEIVANSVLPEDLGQAPDLFFHGGVTAPNLFAEKMRWILSNGTDQISQVLVDGTSQPASYLDQPEPVCDQTGCTFQPAQKVDYFQTVFGNQYEFINSDPGQLNRIWTDGAFRPPDIPGMMWHAQPVKVDIRDVGTNLVVATFWDNSFVTTGGGVGKIFLENHFHAEPFKAHFIEVRDYINFVDADGNGILNFAEPIRPSCDFGVGTCLQPAYLDLAGRMDGVNFVALAGNGLRNAAGDSTFFSDVNRNGLNDDGNALPGINDPFNDFDQAMLLNIYAKNNHWAFTRAENFVIHDDGEVLDFREIFSLGAGTGNSDEKGQIADLFQQLNFERSVTSSEFRGGKIDVVMSPRIFINAGMIEPEGDDSGTEAAGQ